MVGNEARGSLGRVKSWLRSLVQTVPLDMARCEFECRTSACNKERFDVCEPPITYAEAVPSSDHGASATRPAAPS